MNEVKVEASIHQVGDFLVSVFMLAGAKLPHEVNPQLRARTHQVEKIVHSSSSSLRNCLISLFYFTLDSSGKVFGPMPTMLT